MTKKLAEKVGGFIGIFMVSSFVLGLAYSISDGFAGFWGGLPVWVIAVPILGMVCYDYWDTCLRKE